MLISRAPRRKCLTLCIQAKKYYNSHMHQDILPLAKKLIAVPSVAGDRLALDEVLSIAKSELADFHIREFESANIPSFLASHGNRTTTEFKIILNAHVDVVGAVPEQFLPVEKDGKLYGRGSYDMKATAAVMILLFNELAPRLNYPLGLQITADEEIGGKNGTAYQIKQGIKADFVFSGEGTGFKIVNEAKSRMILKLCASGKQSHGAYPWLGDNAIIKLQKAIHDIFELYPHPEEEWSGTTLNVTSIGSSNEITNRTPDHCEAIIDARVIPDEKNTILKKLQEKLNGSIDIEVLLQSQPHQSDPNSKYIKLLKEKIKEVRDFDAPLFRAHGESDARYFTEAGFEGIEFGPIGGNHHALDEWVDIQSLNDYYQILKSFLLSLNTD